MTSAFSIATPKQCVATLTQCVVTLAQSVGGKISHPPSGNSSYVTGVLSFRDSTSACAARGYRNDAKKGLNVRYSREEARQIEYTPLVAPHVSQPPDGRRKLT